MLRLDPDRCNRQIFILFRNDIVCSSSVITDDTQHGLAVIGITREGPQLCGHFSRRAVGLAGHDGGQRAADGQRFGRIVGNALPHQHRAQVGIAEPQRSELKTLLGNRAAGKRSHEYTDF